tara:strand:+ start:737 stop:874 length:138 start_codon:yes stop_codon:yes gene_type:complete
VEDRKHTLVVAVVLATVVEVLVVQVSVAQVLDHLPNQELQVRQVA